MNQLDAIRKLDEFSDLSQGWDSYSGKPIHKEAINTAKAMIWKLGDGWTPIPCSDGGVQLEYHEGGVDIEVQIDVPTEGSK